MVTVIIPIYNERDNLDALFQELLEVLKQLDREWEVVAVNDGSTDGSEQVLDAWADREPRIHVVHLRSNRGQTTAMMAGFDFAQGDVIVPMDADLQNDPADIPRLLTKMDEGYDVVSGWRAKRKDKLLSRRLVSKIANGLISKVASIPLRDFGCTLKAYRREIMHDVRLYGEMHRYIPVFASWHGARITELEVNHRPRTRGSSKYGLDRTHRVMLDLLVIGFMDRFVSKPIHLFGSIALFNFGITVLSVLASIYYKFFGDKSFIETPLPLLAAMTFITGVMFVCMGLLAELVMRTYYESQQKRTYSVRSVRNGTVESIAMAKRPSRSA